MYDDFWTYVQQGDLKWSWDHAVKLNFSGTRARRCGQKSISCYLERFWRYPGISRYLTITITKMGQSTKYTIRHQIKKMNGPKRWVNKNMSLVLLTAVICELTLAWSAGGSLCSSRQSRTTWWSRAVLRWLCKVCHWHTFLVLVWNARTLWTTQGRTDVTWLTRTAGAAGCPFLYVSAAFIFASRASHWVT